MSEMFQSLKMSKDSREFLEDYLPEALEAEKFGELLDLLDDLINEKGFEAPEYESYNLFGRIAQDVYDDIFFSNTKR